MHPIEIIELMIAGGVLAVMAVASFILKNKWRSRMWGLIFIYLVGFSIFYLARPLWIDVQIENKIGYLQEHLEKTYPGEEWQYRTLPHREDGYEHLNPYVIYVTFQNEPGVEYDYYVKDRNYISQVSYSTEVDLPQKLIHLEDLEE